MGYLCLTQILTIFQYRGLSVFNTNFNNICNIQWCSVLFVAKARFNDKIIIAEIAW
jgi:hypothetical protein